RRILSPSPATSSRSPRSRTRSGTDAIPQPDAPPDPPAGRPAKESQMRRSSRGAGLVVLGLAVAVAAGCASETKMKTGSGDIVADRQRVMKLNGAAWAEAQAKAK